MTRAFNPGDFIVQSGLTPEEVARLHIFLRVFMTKTMGVGSNPRSENLETFRLNMVIELKEMHESGAYVRDMAEHFGVSERTIRYWIKAIRDDGEVIPSLRPQTAKIEQFARKCMGRGDFG